MTRRRLTELELRSQLKKKKDSLYYYKNRTEELSESCKSLEVDVEAIAESNSVLRNRILELSLNFSREKRFIFRSLCVLFTTILVTSAISCYYLINFI